MLKTEADDNDMKTLRLKLNAVLRRHPETAKDMADIFDYMDGMLFTPPHTRNRLKSYGLTARGMLVEVRQGGHSANIRVNPEAFKKIIGAIALIKEPSEGVSADKYKCSASSTSLRCTIRFLMHEKLMERSAARYKRVGLKGTWKGKVLNAFEGLEKVSSGTASPPHMQ